MYPVKIYELMPSIESLIPYDYEHIKCDEYENIIKKFITNCKKGNSFEQVSGAPGSGKTTFCKTILNCNFLSFDQIMEELPSYQSDLQKYDNKQAFANNEITARIIGYEILRRAIENKYSLVLEHSGVNPAHLELFTNLKKINYKTKIDFLLCDLNILIERVKLREKNTQRHTPAKMVEQRYLLINDYIKKYQKIADEINIYNSTDNRYTKIKI